MLFHSMGILFLTLGFVNAEVIESPNIILETDELADDATPITTATETPEQMDTPVENILQQFEKIVKDKKKLYNIDLLPADDQEKIINVITNIIEAVKHTDNAHAFLKAKGINRVIVPSLKTGNLDLKTNILILIKVLFGVAPSTTSAVIPVHVVDDVLDIFDNDNLGLKAHAVDILAEWLPENPLIQTRVMKLAGLYTFYKQISNLDIAVVTKLVNLLNKILGEHLAMKNDRNLDENVSKLYQRIGLIEHMSTRASCDQMVKIFGTFWTYNTDENNLIFTVFDMIRTIKPLCVKHFNGRVKPRDLFSKLLEYAKDPENHANFEAHAMHANDMVTEIEDYLANINKYQKPVSDEL